MDKVSIAIATCNRHLDLKECLTSIFGLKCKPHEVIVIDSNSTDGTEKLRDYFPIKFVSINERNRQRVRSIGISFATRKIIAFLGDAYYFPQRRKIRFGHRKPIF